MSFFGGGTDMENFFQKYGGAVLSTTFDKYCYVTVRHLPPFFDYTTELAYSKQERVKTIEEIEHPAIRNAMKMLSMRNIRLTYEADLPARSGLGTSSSFAVGMLNAFHALKGEYADKKGWPMKRFTWSERFARRLAGGRIRLRLRLGGSTASILVQKDMKYCLLLFQVNEKNGSIKI